MIRSLVLSLTALGAVVALLADTPAKALNNKSFVSGTGSDANNCSTIPLACATFAHALTQTNAGGEITVVNTGDYQPLTIDRSIDITNDGAGEASILAPGTGGIFVRAGKGDVIGLRGLVIDGQVFGMVGMEIDQASAVHIQNCVFRNFESSLDFTYAILSQPTNNLQIFISDTIIFNNGSTAHSGGILIFPGTGGNAHLVLDRVHLENNVTALSVNASNGTPSGIGVYVIIRDSVDRKSVV